MRKFLITMMCIIMVVCFMPTVAMAETTQNCPGSCGHVASIGTTHYDTLKAAVDAVNADGTETTIKLIGNITDISTVEICQGKSIILDLNGHTIEAAVRSDDASKHYYAIDNHGQFTLKDTSIGQTGSITARGIENLGYGVMTIESGKIIAQDSNGGACIWNEATLFVNGGNFETIHVGSSSDNVGVACLNNSGTATITAGNFDDVNKRTYAIISTGDIEITPAKGKTVSVTGAHGGLAIDSGVAVVNGGTYFSSEYYGLYVSNDGVGTDPMQAAVTVNDGSFDGANYSVWIGSDHNNPVNSTIEINGGKFNKPLNAQSCTREGAISIKGGTFSVDPSKYVATGYITTNQGDVWTVSETHKVAKIGDKKYETLADAVEYVKDGETIELLSNCNGNGIIVKGNSNRTFTIDFNNFSYTVDGSELAGSEGTKSQCFQLLKGSTITMKDGSIIADNPACAMMLQNYSNLTLENMNIDATTGANSVDYVVSNNCGNVTIKGSTSIKAKAGKHAFDLYYWPEGGYAEGVNVTVDTTGTIDGIIKYGSDNSTGAAEGMHDKCKLEIKNGTFNGSISTYNCDNNPNIVITGGTFSTNPKKYVASGYTVTGSGPFTVKAISSGVPSLPPIPTDNVTNSGTSGTDNATTSADLSGSISTSNGTTSATVDKTTADKIVDKVVENKSTEVVIDATANTTTAANSTTIAQVTIPTETLGAIAEKTEADVTIKTDVAEVKMDNAAAAAVSEQAEGDTVQIIAEKVAEETDKVEFELKVVCSDGKVISDFKGGNVAVTVALPKAMAEKKVVCVYIDDNGHMSKMEGQKNADGTYTFSTGHFSSYAIMAEEEADAAIAAQKEAIKNIKIKLTSKQVKTKAGKKAVKITWTAAAGDKVLDGVEVYRSTERYKGYGTEPFYTSTKGGNTGSYTNTKSLKKGTKYYYRVRGYVLVDGQKVYTDYSTKAWRTVK